MRDTTYDEMAGRFSMAFENTPLDSALFILFYFYLLLMLVEVCVISWHQSTRMYVI